MEEKKVEETLLSFHQCSFDINNISDDPCTSTLVHDHGTSGVCLHLCCQFCQSRYIWCNNDQYKNYITDDDIKDVFRKHDGNDYKKYRTFQQYLISQLGVIFLCNDQQYINIICEIFSIYVSRLNLVKLKDSFSVLEIVKYCQEHKISIYRKNRGRQNKHEKMTEISKYFIKVLKNTQTPKRKTSDNKSNNSKKPRLTPITTKPKCKWMISNHKNESQRAEAQTITTTKESKKGKTPDDNLNQQSSTPKWNIEFPNDTYNDKEESTIRHSISKKHRTLIWDFYIGESKRQGNCYSCNKIIKFENFECGHIVASKNGGSDETENIRPICGPCNKSCQTRHLDEFKKSLNVQPLQNDEFFKKSLKIMPVCIFTGCSNTDDITITRVDQTDTQSEKDYGNYITIKKSLLSYFNDCFLSIEEDGNILKVPGVKQQCIDLKDINKINPDYYDFKKLINKFWASHRGQHKSY